MVMKLSIAVAIGIALGSGMPQPDFQTFTAAPAFERKIDFDQVFADVTRQGAGYVDRAHKSDRLPNFEVVSPESALLPYCEPLASEFADPVFGRIVGRCDA